MGMGVGGGERGVWELLCGVLCKKDRIRFIGHFRAEFTVARLWTLESARDDARKVFCVRRL